MPKIGVCRLLKSRSPFTVDRIWRPPPIYGKAVPPWKRVTIFSWKWVCASSSKKSSLYTHFLDPPTQNIQILLLALATRTRPRLTVTTHYESDRRQHRARGSADLGPEHSPQRVAKSYHRPPGQANLVGVRLPPPATGCTVLRGLLNPQR